MMQANMCGNTDEGGSLKVAIGFAIGFVSTITIGMRVHFICVFRLKRTGGVTVIKDQSVNGIRCHLAFEVFACFSASSVCKARVDVSSPVK